MFFCDHVHSVARVIGTGATGPMLYLSIEPTPNNLFSNRTDGSLRTVALLGHYSEMTLCACSNFKDTKTSRASCYEGICFSIRAVSSSCPIVDAFHRHLGKVFPDQHRNPASRHPSTFSICLSHTPHTYIRLNRASVICKVLRPGLRLTVPC